MEKARSDKSKSLHKSAEQVGEVPGRQQEQESPTSFITAAKSPWGSGQQKLPDWVLCQTGCSEQACQMQWCHGGIDLPSRGKESGTY